MLGGGPGAFIGAVHRMAARMDGEIELVAGAFSSRPEASAAMGRELYLDPDRVYDSWEQLLDAEAERAENAASNPSAAPLDFVAIVTPNGLHYPMARRALERGFDVICDKPMTTSLADAEDLCRLVTDTGRMFVLTHNYTGYPMVRQARAMVRAGELGRVRKIVVEYPQGWLSTLLEASGNKQAVWRTDPAMAGPSSALGDIGTHCENLVHFVTGLEMAELFADLGSVVIGRDMEDDASLLIHYDGGARGILYASQISVGEENNLTLRVYGERAALTWRQEHPNQLHLLTSNGPAQVLTRASSYLSPEASDASRLPPGHPEGFIEGFANLYRDAATAFRTREQGLLPTVQDGARGMHFIETALRSSRERQWMDARYTPPGG
ncbi:MAG: Gfo/Idh/MocA family oxidoreductase [Rhodothermales bacterium]